MLPRKPPAVVTFLVDRLSLKTAVLTFLIDRLTLDQYSVWLLKRCKNWSELLANSTKNYDEVVTKFRLWSIVSKYCIECSDLNWASWMFGVTRVCSTTTKFNYHFLPMNLMVQSIYHLSSLSLVGEMFFPRTVMLLKFSDLCELQEMLLIKSILHNDKFFRYFKNVRNSYYSPLIKMRKTFFNKQYNLKHIWCAEHLNLIYFKVVYISTLTSVQLNLKKMHSHGLRWGKAI